MSRKSQLLDLRKTGLTVAGGVPWGTHFCQFYETKKDLVDTVVPYFKTGLEQHEFCLWVISGLLDEDEARHALGQAIPNLDRHVRECAIEIVSQADWYGKLGAFDPDRAANAWMEKLSQALARDYAGMRATGDTWLLEKNDWKGLSDYERTVNDMMKGKRMLLLCTYPMARCRASEILGAARSHELAIAQRHGGWERVEPADLKRTKVENRKPTRELDKRVAVRTRERTGANEALMREIAELRKAQEALMKVAEERAAELAQERQALAQSEESNRLKDQFLATISHELRTPLTSIVGWTKLLRERHVDDSQLRQAIDVIDRNAALEVRLVDDILDMFSILTGKFRIQFQPLSLQSVLASALDAVRPIAESKAIRVENKVDGVCSIDGDPMRLQQAFWNLLSNAIKFTPQGGRVIVATEENGEEIRTLITDTGMGISQEALPHVFERFWQADSSRAKAHGGLGLGLAIAQSIVQNHGGTIEAVSPGPGEGATFVVRLHRQRSHQH